MIVFQSRRHIQRILLLLVLQVGIVSDQLYAAETPTQTSSKFKLLVVGDSLSAAYRLQQQEGWVSLLQNMWYDEQRKIEIVNAAISGETTDGALSRLPRLLDQHQPSHVFIELGGNDGLRGNQIAGMKKNLREMVTMAKEAGAEVILQDMEIPPNYGKRYTRMFADSFDEIAEEEEVAIIPFFLEDIALNKKLMQKDGIHPNAEAQTLIAEYMHMKLSPLITD
ncbi:arylesterase [Alteromonas pelagimontana]|uniref:Arylesterase n=1 Tax=Alteromonas pelagimontana TaxID=1858656 RepID=A0A6M4M9D3_9ALTE|nr:arylesterase [Alteromonas pelagimontana]QJR79773.1 arylesterase [Alteromonas pelagimontana]